MNVNSGLCRSIGSGHRLKPELEKLEADLLAGHGEEDATRLKAELRELGHDLKDRDLFQARVRLFFVVSSLLLDECLCAGDTALLRTASVMREQRRCFEQPVCRLYQRFCQLWTASLQADLEAYRQRSGDHEMHAYRLLVDQQHEEIQEMLYCPDGDKKVLAVHELLQRVRDAEALRCLRRARKSLERYRTYLQAEQDSCRIPQESPTPTVVVPDWQRQIDEECAIHRHYATRIEEIEQDSSLSDTVRAECLEKLRMGWELAHSEMMQPVQEGEIACDTWPDDHSADVVPWEPGHNVDRRSPLESRPTDSRFS